MSYIYQSYVLHLTGKQKILIDDFMQANNIILDGCLLYMSQKKANGEYPTFSMIVSKFYDLIYTKVDRRFADPSMFKPMIHKLYKAYEICKNTQKKHKVKKNNFQLNKIPSFSKDEIFIEKLGNFRWKRRHFPNGEVTNAYIMKEGTKKYKLWLLFKLDDEIEARKCEKAVGIDIGIWHFLNLSDGTKIDKPNFYDRYEAKISKLVKILSKKRKNGSNFTKIKNKLNRLREKAHDSKYSFLHRLSSELSDRYDLICMETLAVSEFTKKGGRKSILWNDASVKIFQSMLRYKCALKGKRFLLAPKYFPSSQICSRCGTRDRSLKQISIKTWRCKQCTITHDRDLNAAVNLRRYGLRQLGLEPY